MKFDLQLFGGGGIGGMLFGNKGSSSSSYKPSAEERELYKIGLENAKQVNPYIGNLLTQGYDKLQNGLVDVDYKGLMSNALEQVNNAQQGLSGLAQGKLPTAFTDNMTAAIQSGVDKTVGGTLNNLAGRGILNSSVTSGAMNDISKNVSDTMAQQYQGNVGLLGNIFGQQIGSAGTGLGIGQAGQQAAMSQGQSLLGTAGNLQGTYINGLLGAIKGNGTATKTETPADGGLLGLAGQAWLGSQSKKW